LVQVLRFEVEVHLSHHRYERRKTVCNRSTSKIGAVDRRVAWAVDTVGKWNLKRFASALLSSLSCFTSPKVR
jgi:hypothetical protein